MIRFLARTVLAPLLLRSAKAQEKVTVGHHKCNPRSLPGESMTRRLRGPWR
jgi:hypothetical protein